MGTRGPKPLPPNVTSMRGTDQPCRARESAVETLKGAPKKPAWLKGRAAKLWKEKLDIYKGRGQNIRGNESALAQYCSIEATLIEEYWIPGKKPNTSLLSVFKTFAVEFYDTPASQVVSKAPKKGNAFSNNGK